MLCWAMGTVNTLIKTSTWLKPDDSLEYFKPSELSKPLSSVIVSCNNTEIKIEVDKSGVESGVTAKHLAWVSYFILLLLQLSTSEGPIKGHSKACLPLKEPPSNRLREDGHEMVQLLTYGPIDNPHTLSNLDKLCSYIFE